MDDLNNQPSRAIGKTFQWDEHPELTRADIARICRVGNSMWNGHNFGLTGACKRCGFTLQEMRRIQQESSGEQLPTE